MKVASIARPGLRLTLNPPVAPFVLDRRTKHNTMWLPFRVPAMQRALPVPMKQPHPVRPSIAVAVIVKMESTKPVVLLLDPVVIFVQLDLLLRPRPRVVRDALEPSIKPKMLLNLLHVLLIPPVLLAGTAAHQQFPSTERVPIVNRLNSKHRAHLMGLHAHRGPPVELEKRDPLRPPPPTVPVPRALRRNTKHKQPSRVLLACVGPHAMLGKKDPHLLHILIVFAPIASRVSFKPRVCRPQNRVRIVQLEKAM